MKLRNPIQVDESGKRTISDDEKKVIAEWIEKDYFHKPGEGSPEFFEADGTETIAIEDEEGNVAYARLSRALRIHMVFDPSQRKRNAEMLTEFTAWIAQSAADSGHKELVFSSENKALRDFEENLGFSPSPNDMVMSLRKEG